MKLSIAVALAWALPPATAVNFIVVQPDDMHWYSEWNPPPAFSGDSPPTGGGSALLPWINKLREDGVVMTNAYAAAPKCGTSRYSTVTGRMPSRSSHGRKEGIADGADWQTPARVTIPTTKLRDIAPSGGVEDGMDCSEGNVAQVLSKNGYKTGMVGKWHLTNKKQADGGTHQGYVDEINNCGFFNASAVYPDNLDAGALVSHNMEDVAKGAVDFIEENQGSPWFLYVNPTVPHGPDVSAAMNMDCQSTTKDPSGSGNVMSVEGMTTGWSTPDKSEAMEFGGNCSSYRQFIRMRASNSTSNDDLGSIWVDDTIGAIYKALDRTGQLDDTLIVFQLDHGKYKKDKLWEGGVRIPQFVHYPAAFGTTGREWSGLVSTIDIAPTLIDFAGIDKNDPNSEVHKMDGESWKEAVAENSGKEAAWRDSRCLFFESQDDRAVRCGCDKFMMLSADSPEGAEASANNYWSGQEALFNLCASGSTSPEEDNKATSETAKADDLRDILQCHLNRTDATIVPDYDTVCTGSVATPSPTVSPAPTPPVANNGGNALVLEYFPWQGDIFALNEDLHLSATVIDDDLRRVRFIVRKPNGDNIKSNGQQDPLSISGDKSTYELTIPASDLSDPGKYRFKIQIEDDSGNDVCFPGNCTDPEMFAFVRANSAEQILVAAREEIKEVISDANMPSNGGINLAAKFVRHSFHDCVGGCDGCVDMANGDNAGLDVPIAALDPVVALFTHYGVTRADIWVLAGLTAASVTQEDADGNLRDFDMDYYGRPNCVGEQDGGPHRDLPLPDEDTHSLLDFFSNAFGTTEDPWTNRDTVAIMGAHSLGGLARENSGFNGPNGWDGQTRVLNKAYYDSLVGGTSYDPLTCDTSETSSDPCLTDELMAVNNWDLELVNNEEGETYLNGTNPAGMPPSRYQWERGANPDQFVMVNSDMALVRDFATESGHMKDEGGNDVTNDRDARINKPIEITCMFRCRKKSCQASACPHAAATIGIAAEYKHNNALFLKEFEGAFKKMLKFGDYKKVDTACLPLPGAPCKVEAATARRNLRGEGKQ